MSTILNTKWIRAVLLALVVALSGAALSACMPEAHSEDGVEVVIEGEPVDLGPLQFNTLFSRPLNRFDVEDRYYLVGQPPPPPGSTYLGVFVRIKNKDEEKAHVIPDSFSIVDTRGDVVENTPSDSIFAVPTGTKIEPGEQIPQIDSPSQVGTIQASLLLFEIKDEVLELRPVRLELEYEGEKAEVDLDL
jgi:hypothetical protein